MSSIDTIILKIHKITTTHSLLASVIQKKKKIYAQEILKTKIEENQYQKILKSGQKKIEEVNLKNGRLRMQKEIRKTIADIEHQKSTSHEFNINNYKETFNHEEIELIRNSDNIKDCLIFMLKEKSKQLTEDEIFSTFINVLENEQKKKDVVTIRKYYKDNKVKLVPNSIFGKIGSNSHHYDIRFKLDWTNDFLELEFSIPKALYGTNVFQNIYHKQNGIFSKIDKISNISFQANYMIHQLNNQLKDIFMSYFQIDYNKMDKTEIEISRIDICYNQVFKTKQTALSYLNQQKQIKKKWERTDNFTPRSTSVSWTSKGSNFKIYHKGSEFEKHDKKKLYKVNSKRRQTKQQIIDIDSIQELANRTLRYEMTYRSKKISDIYKTHYHFSTNPTNDNEQELINNAYQQLKTDVNRWRYLFLKHGGGKDKYQLENNKIKYENKYEIRLGKKISLGKKPIFKKSWIEYKKLTNNENERNRLVSWSKWFDNVAKCYLDNSPDYNCKNSENIERVYNYNNLTYNSSQMFDRFVFVPNFWKNLVNHFWQTVQHFEINELEDETEFLTRLEKRNQKIQKNLDVDNWRKHRKLEPLKRFYHEKHKYNIGTMKLLHFLVKEKGFKQIESEEMFPRSTWERHKARLKELGITSQSVSFKHEKPRFDHYRYHQFIHYNNQILRSQLKGFKYLNI